MYKEEFLDLFALSETLEVQKCLPRFPNWHSSNISKSDQKSFSFKLQLRRCINPMHLLSSFGSSI